MLLTKLQVQEKKMEGVPVRTAIDLDELLYNVTTMRNIVDNFSKQITDYETYVHNQQRRHEKELQKLNKKVACLRVHFYAICLLCMVHVYVSLAAWVVFKLA